MTTALVILHIICCLLLIVVILIQGGRGQGLTGPSFASGNVQSLFGTRAGDVLTKATSVAAICFLLTCIALDYLEAQKSRSLLEGPRQAAPLDMEKLKEALEKVKRETAAGSGSQPKAPEMPAAGSAAPMPSPAENTSPNPVSAENPSPAPETILPQDTTVTTQPAESNAT